MIETHKATMRRADPGDSHNTRCRFVNGRVGAGVRNASEDGSIDDIDDIDDVDESQKRRGRFDIDFG
jgi:hypothetical protein